MGAALALLPGNATGATAPTITTKDLLLRLVDLTPGYRVGNDGGCGFGGSPGVTVACAIDFRQLWVAPGDAPGPDRVEATATLFETAAGADSALAQWDGAAPSPAPWQVGDATRLFAPNASYATVVWRSGPVVASVHVSDAPSAIATAMQLAERQQARMTSPRPLAPEDNDDLTVALDNPAMPIPVYWLGKTFSSRRLPRLTLTETSAYPGDACCEPGFTAEAVYGWARGGVSIEIWKPAHWRRFRNSPLVKHLMHNRHTKRIRERMGARRVIILATYEACRRSYAIRPARDKRNSLVAGAPAAGTYRREREKPCGAGRRDLFMAQVHFRDMVVSVTGQGPRSDPYNSVRGMRAIARRLRLRRGRGKLPL